MMYRIRRSMAFVRFVQRLMDIDSDIAEAIQTNLHVESQLTGGRGLKKAFHTANHKIRLDTNIIMTFEE